MQILAGQLQKFGEAVFKASGADKDAAIQVTERLIEANLFGHDSHGIGMIPAYVMGIKEGQLKPASILSVEQDRGVFLLLNGNAGFGQLIAKNAMQLAISRTQKLGAAVVGLKNSYHIGRIGAWGEMCAAAGFISIHFVNCYAFHALVAPFGGSDARFTTNPYCTALPASKGADPIILDMATSQVAMGKVRVAYNQGKEMKPGDLIDHQGNPTNDPSVMFSEPKGALQSMGLHKGYGLAVICEALAGAFTGGGVFDLNAMVPGRIINNMLTIVIDPDIFGNKADFDAEINKFSTWVKASPPIAGGDGVMLPGDPERVLKRDRISNGIPLDNLTVAELLDAAEEVSISRTEAMRLLVN